MASEADIKRQERNAFKAIEWKDGEWGYLCCLIAQHGDANVGRDPKTVAAYLRLQASGAFRSKHYRLAACIGAAASLVNCDARNDHAPEWDRARKALDEVSDNGA